VSECITIVLPQATERGLILTAHIPDGLPPLESDRDKIKQVLLNLLTNAVKYNRPYGSITVTVSAGPERIRTRVADTGKGIPAGGAARLFEKFYRAPDSDQYASGTGLGLPIAKRIVEALGGEIGVLPSEGEGSLFFFDLPLDSKNSEPASA